MEGTSALSTLADLLKKPTSLPPLTNNPPDPTQSDNFATILDLGSSDRYRVLKLIEELLDSQEEVDQLKEKLAEDKAEFREKRSTLLKKLDVQSEKYERALTDIEMLKEKHSNSLRILEEKICIVSCKFEASVEEAAKLRKENADLKKENLALRKLNCDSTTTVSLIQEENSKLNTKLESSKQNEKSLKKQLKRFSSGINLYPESLHSYTISRTPSAVEANDRNHEPQNLNQPYREGGKPLELGHHRGGAGDFSNFPHSSSSRVNYVLNTIKAPPTKDPLQSTIAFSNSNGNKMDPTGKVSSSQIQSTLAPPKNMTYSLEDSTILENLFFRF